MPKQATPVELSAEDKRTLHGWIKDAVDSQLRAQRARIILLAAEQRSTEQIARALGVRAARVSKWRTRFATAGLPGLEDVARPGKPRQYNEVVDRRILSLVEEPPPSGALVWTGPLLARALGNVSLDYVWKVLRKSGVKLRRRDRLEVETRSSGRTRLAAMIGLYLSSRSSAFLIGTRDEGTITPPAVRGFVRVASPEAAAELRAVAVEKGLSLLSALQWALTLAERGLYTGRSTRSLDEFLSEAKSWVAAGEIHVFFVGSVVQPHPDLHIFEIPTLAAFKEHLRSWLVPLWNGTVPPNADIPSRLVSAAERFVLTRHSILQASFEWHARIPLVNRGEAACERGSVPVSGERY